MKSTDLLTRMLAANTLAQMPRCRFQYGMENQLPCIRAATRQAINNPCGNPPLEMCVCDVHADVWRAGRQPMHEKGYPDYDAPTIWEHIETRDLPDAARIRELERIAWSK